MCIQQYTCIDTWKRRRLRSRCGEDLATMSVPKRDTSLEAFKCYVCNEVVDMVTHLRLSRLPEVDGQRQSQREERRAQL